MENSAKHSAFYLWFGLTMLAFTLWALYDWFRCEPVQCNPSPSYWDCASEFIIFLPLTLFFLSRPLWNIKWDSDHIYHRTWYGLPLKTPLSAIENIDFNYFSNDGTLEFLDQRKLYIGSRLENLEELFDILETHLGRKYPHKVYRMAYREIVEMSQNCGCLICYSIYPKSEISIWSRYCTGIQEDMSDDDDVGDLNQIDIAVCPVCNLSEGVIADLSKSVISIDEMQMWNKENDERLDPEERMKRQSLRTRVSKKLQKL